MFLINGSQLPAAAIAARVKRTVNENPLALVEVTQIDPVKRAAIKKILPHLLDEGAIPRVDEEGENWIRFTRIAT